MCYTIGISIFLLDGSMEYNKKIGAYERVTIFLLDGSMEYNKKIGAYKRAAIFLLDGNNIITIIYYIFYNSITI